MLQRSHSRCIGLVAMRTHVYCIYVHVEIGCSSVRMIHDGTASQLARQAEFTDRLAPHFKV